MVEILILTIISAGCGAFILVCVIGCMYIWLCVHYYICKECAHWVLLRIRCCLFVWLVFFVVVAIADSFQISNIEFLLLLFHHFVHLVCKQTHTQINWIFIVDIGVVVVYFYFFRMEWIFCGVIKCITIPINCGSI